MSLFNNNEALAALIGEIVRVGIVSSIDPANATARVLFPDRDDQVSHNLKVIMPTTGGAKNYSMPDINDAALCLFLPNGIEQGFILGSYYSQANQPPITNQKVRHVTFEDGTTAEYDRGTHTLKIDVPESAGKVVINCAGRVVVNSPKIDLGEGSSLEPSVLGDQLAAFLDALRTELDNHTHPGNLGAPTGPAMAIKPFEFIELLAGGAAYSTKNRNQ